MNKLTALLAALTLMLTTSVYAASDHNAHGATNHSGHQAVKDAKDAAAGHGDHNSGMKIHTATLDGYTFEYRLIDMKEKVKHMKNMPEITDTHHLMVFVKDAHGAAVKTAKVGYYIQENGSGAVQKKMAMAMNDGFGADVTLKPGNHYQIRTKVMAGSQKLMDEFKYTGGGH